MLNYSVAELRIFYVFILYFHDINKGAGFQPGFYYIHLF